MMSPGFGRIKQLNMVIGRAIPTSHLFLAHVNRLMHVLLCDETVPVAAAVDCLPAAHHEYTLESMNSSSLCSN